MNQYLLLLYGTPNTESTWTPEEMQAIVREYGVWASELGAREALVAGEKLMAEGGRLMRHDGGGVTVTDGPYAEAREVLGGFFIIKADSYAAAVEIAKTCPHARYGVRTEVRQIELFEPVEAT